MIAVDDGLVSGNLDFADILFLLACIVAVIAAALSLKPQPKVSAAALGWLAVALIALGWFVL